MLRLMIVLLILFAAVWGGTQLAQHPGYVLIAYDQWVIEMPMWLSIVGISILFLVLYSFLRTWAFLDNVHNRIRQWWRGRRFSKALGKTDQGLLEFIEEKWSTAEKHLLQGVNPQKNPVVNYLMAAKAAAELKDFERAETYLQKAYLIAPQDELVIGLAQVKLQLEQGHLEQAQAVLMRLRKLAPRHPAVLKALERVYIQRKEWQKMLELLPHLQKAKAITRAQYALFEKNIYNELLQEAGHKHRSIHEVRELWQTTPKKIRQQPEVLASYAHLMKEDKTSAEEIEGLIRKALKQKWHEDLVKVYSLLASIDPQRQLLTAEEWLRQYGPRPALLLTLARLSQKCGREEQAKDYLEQSLKLDVADS